MPEYITPQQLASMNQPEQSGTQKQLSEGVATLDKVNQLADKLLNIFNTIGQIQKVKYMMTGQKEPQATDNTFNAKVEKEVNNRISEAQNMSSSSSNQNAINSSAGSKPLTRKAYIYVHKKEASDAIMEMLNKLDENKTVKEAKEEINLAHSTGMLSSLIEQFILNNSEVQYVNSSD